MSVVSAVTEKLRGWLWDPLGFCNDVFIEKPREWQPEVIDAVRTNPWTAVAACRKAGKTRLAAYIALWFLCTRANSLVMTIAPRWAQVEQALWADIRYLWVTSKLPQIFPAWDVQLTEIKTHPLTPKWRAMGLASNDVQNLEGRHPAAGQPALIIVDESKGVADPFFDSLMGMLAELDAGNILLGIGTPGPPLGWFARAFSRDRKLWGFTKQIRADKIPRLAGHCERERQRLGADNPFFRQQQLAEFCGADEGAAIPMDALQRAIGRRMVLDHSWPKTASLDVGGKGEDRSVLTFRHGPVIIKQIDWQGWDEMKTAARAAQLVVSHRPSVFAIDEVGIGAGVRSRLQQLLAQSGIRIAGFNGGRRARDREQYANLKAEEIFFLRKRFIEDQIAIPNHPDLISELCSWTTDFDTKGRTRIVDPEDSPDFADSCMMAFAADRLGQSAKGVTPAFLQ